MFLRVESYKRGIILSTVFNVFNKGLVFANSLVVAYFFGTQLNTDIYFFVYACLILFVGFISGLNSTVLVPESMRIRKQENERAAMEFLNFFLYGYLLLTMLLVLIFFMDPVSIFAHLSKFTHPDLARNASILYLSLPLFILMALTTMLTDVLASYKYFTISMIVGIFNGLFSILFIFFFHRSLGILSILTGLLSSYFINLLMLLYLMKRQLNWNFSSVKGKIGKRIWKNIGFAQAGNITTTLYSYAPMYLFSGVNVGTITALSFAQQIAGMPTTLITNQVSTVAGIKLNELHALGEAKKMDEIFFTSTDFLLFILMPMSVLLFLFPREVVLLLFKRGAFDLQSVTRCALFLKYLGLLLPMLAINTLGARLFMATHKVKHAFWYQIVLNLFLVVLIYTGVKLFDVYGYLWAMLFIYLLSTLLQYYLFRAWFRNIDYARVLVSFFKLLVLNAVIGSIVHFLVRFLIPGQGAIVTLLFGSFAYLIILLLTNSLFRLNSELLDLTHRILRLRLN
ncbi:MAG TPA: lipid II flippase MurJ [Puia sp.]|nr:lipid II flippase MurJ [Puia sp.]